MFRRESYKYLILAAIIGYISLPILNYFGLDHSKYVGVISIYTFLFSIILAVFTFMAWMCDDLDARLYNYIFGKYHYNFMYTFSLLPGVVYAFACEYYFYMGIAFGTFLILEFYRTRQNEYAQEWADEEAARALRNSKKQEVNLS